MSMLAVLLLLLVASPVAAVPILKFDDPIAPGGTVAWPGAGPITGTDIQFQSILGLDTPLNAGVTLACVGCLMDFTTGAATATTTANGALLVTALPGVSIEITGAVPALGIGAGTTLLLGTFTGAPTEVIGAGEAFGLFVGSGTDIKDPVLAAFYGLDPLQFTFGTTSIQSIAAQDPLTSAFAGQVVNADLNNTSVAPGQQQAVPNPMGWMLLVLGLPILRVWRPSRAD